MSLLWNTKLSQLVWPPFLRDRVHYRGNKAKKSAERPKFHHQLCYLLAFWLGAYHLTSTGLNNLTFPAFLAALLQGSKGWHMHKHSESHTTYYKI